MAKVTIRSIIAQFDSHCGGCGEELYAGERIMYDTEARVAYCTECGEYEEEHQRAMCQKLDDDLRNFEDC